MLGSFGLIIYHENFVTKIEPIRTTSNNEVDVYLRLFNKDKINDWMIKNNIKYLGVPILIETNVIETYNYITTYNYGLSLDKLLDNYSFEDYKNIFNTVLDVLKYLHSNKIIHNDIKPQNITVPNENRPHEIILLDYGLSSKNNTYFDTFIGTRLFCSINAHRCTTLNYRDDIESLAFNLLYWTTKKLLWQKKEPNKVIEYKIKFKKNYAMYLKNCELMKVFFYVFSLNKYDHINYDRLKF